MKFFAVILVSVFLITSCSKSNNGSSSTPAVPEEIKDPVYDKSDFEPSKVNPNPPAGEQVELQTEFGRIMDAMILDCETDCAESVGFMGLNGQQGYSVCTGSLIGEDLLLTNRHCVEEVQHTMGDKSRPTCAIKFPKMSDDMEEEIAFCDSVIKITDRNGKRGVSHRDYAIVKLNRKVERKIYSVNRAGFSQGDSHTIYSVNPVPHATKLRGKMVIKTGCEPVYNTALAADFGYKDGPRVATFNCTAMGGNSGSPVFGKDGNIHGILWGSANFDFLKERFTSQPGLRKDFIYMTNFMCESWPGFDSNVPAACANVDARAAANEEKILIKSVDFIERGLLKTLAVKAVNDFSNYDDFTKSFADAKLEFSSTFGASSLILDQPTSVSKKLIPANHYIHTKAASQLKINCFFDSQPNTPKVLAVPTAMNYKISPRMDEMWRIIGFEVSDLNIQRTDGFELKASSGGTILGMNRDNVTGGTFSPMSISVCQ